MNNKIKYKTVILEAKQISLAHQSTETMILLDRLNTNKSGFSLIEMLWWDIREGCALTKACKSQRTEAILKRRVGQNYFITCWRLIKSEGKPLP